MMFTRHKRILSLSWVALFLLTAGSVLASKGTIKREGPVVTTESGLQYSDLVVGTGPSPLPGGAITVHYEGWLLDGTKFDSSRDRNELFKATLGKGMLIEGWEEGLLGMREGGVRKLIIPPHLGYGSRGVPNVIPPNATIVFEIELLEVR